jgi:hypothetical protein
MGTGQNSSICRRSGPTSSAARRLPRKGCELVEKLRDVVLNRSDYLSSVLRRHRRVVETGHPGCEAAQFHIAHDVRAEDWITGREPEKPVPSEHRQNVSRARKFQDLDDERHLPRSARPEDALSRQRSCRAACHIGNSGVSVRGNG